MCTSTCIEDAQLHTFGSFANTFTPDTPKGTAGVKVYQVSDMHLRCKGMGCNPNGVEVYVHLTSLMHSTAGELCTSFSFGLHLSKT